MNIEEEAMEVMGFISASVIDKEPSLGYDRLLKFIHEALKKQREICAEHLHKNNGCSDDCEECKDDMNVIKSAPEPEGSEK